MNINNPSLPRRDFIKHCAATAATSALTFPAIVSGAPTSERLKIGLIGCGGRGTGAANQALNADSNVVLWAVGDAFDDKIGTSLESLKASHEKRIEVPQERRFAGLDAFKRVIDSG